MRRHLSTVLPLLCVALALTLGFSSPTFAQEETSATVSGQVTDSTGALIPNATVIITAKATSVERRVQTNEDGFYTAANLSPGDYTIVIEQSNFKRHELNITLSAKDRRIANIALEAGAVSETVLITDEAPLVQESPTGQGLISGTQVIELPLNNRNFMKLTELVPGVASALDDEATFGLTSRADISINGMRRNGVNYFVDGVSNTDVGSNITLLSTPTIDSIKEFKILTSNYTAEIGRSGGGAVTLVTKGGSNDYHGSLYEFVRNDYFNANTYFNNRTGRNADGTPRNPTPKLRYNNYGFTLSGPVTIPTFGEGEKGRSIYQAKNKTFFFFSEEVRKITRASSELGATTISQAQRTGDFSALLGLPLYRQANGTSNTTVTATPLFITNTAGGVEQARVGMVFRPTDGRAYVGNIIPEADISPLAKAYFPAFPLATSGAKGFFSVPININNTRQESIRIDHNFNDNHRLFGRYTHDLSETIESGGLFNNLAFPNISTTDTRVPGHVLAISMTSILSPAIVNEATYNFSGNLIGSELTGLGRRSDYAGTGLIPEAFPENNNNAIAELNFAGNDVASRLGSLQGFNIKYTNQVVRDIVTWTRGNHTFKFGGELSWEAKDENANNITGGSFTFNSTTTQGSSTVPGVTAPVALTQTGSAIASFLLGRSTQYVEDEIDVTVNLRFGRREVFAQDTWRIRPNLTLDYGVRYQYFVPVTDENNVLTSFFPSLYNRSAVPTCTTAACTALVRGTGNEFNGIAVAGSTSPFGGAVSPSDKNNFSPRVGIAWSPNFEGSFMKTLFGEQGQSVFRAGYGFYYDQVLVGIFEQNAFVNPPYNNRATYTGNVTLGSPTGGALGAVPIRNLIASAEDFTTPEIQQWSIGWQREVFRRGVIDLSYVGTKGDHLIRQRNINLPDPADVLRVGTGSRNTVRPFLGYGTINYRDSSAKSRYHGFLSSFNYRFGNGFSLTAAYTFSKNLTDATNDRDAIDDPQNPRDLRPEYAEARTSRPHIFSASYVYEIPFFAKTNNTAKRLFLAGWQISGITTIASGQPLPRVLNATGDEIRGGRARLVGDPNSGGTFGTVDSVGLPFIFNSQAFALPVDGTYGNSGRAFGRRPGQNQTNLSAVKNIYFNTERSFYLQLRAEGFNIFNHTQFLMNDTNSFSLSVPATLGRPTSTRLPREFQFAAKLYF